MQIIGRRLLIMATVLVAASRARATPRMPMAVQDDLNLGYTIQCSLCHVDGNAGPGTAHTPFALSARAFGMDGSSRALLATALSQMEAAGTDSDGDGVPDISELRAGDDPNVFGPVPLAGRVDPSYGCGSADGGALALCALLTTLAVWRRRATRRIGVPPA